MKDVIDLVSPPSYLAVVDIQAAYRAVSIYPGHRKYLGSKWTLDGKEVFLEDNRLCFGLSSGPYYFNSISNFVAHVLRNIFNVSVVQYLDDYMVVSSTAEGATSDQHTTINLLRFLGFHISWAKVTHPSTTATYLGVEIDTVAMELRLPLEKVEKFKSMVGRFSSAVFISKKDLERLNGVLSHCAQVVQGGRIFARRCYNMYKEMINSHRKRMRISKGMHEDLDWWRRFAPDFNGVSLIPYVTHPDPIQTDASKNGYGPIWGESWIIGIWNCHIETLELDSPCTHVVNPPHFEEQLVENINVLELWAVVAALELWGKECKDQTICIITDNRQVIL